MSASNTSRREPIRAPCCRYASSGNPARIPASVSTRTSMPALARVGTTVGTSATRVSPGNVSRGTPTRSRSASMAPASQAPYPALTAARPGLPGTFGQRNPVRCTAPCTGVFARASEPDGLTDDGLQPLGGTALGIGEVDLVVLATHRVVVLGDERVELLDRRPLLPVRTHVHDLGRQPLAEALQAHLPQRRKPAPQRGLDAGPAHQLLGHDGRLHDHRGPAPSPAILEVEL